MVKNQVNYYKHACTSCVNSFQVTHRAPLECVESWSLNSSGSEDGTSPPDYIRKIQVPTNPSSCIPVDRGTGPSLPTAGQLNAALYRVKENLNEPEFDVGRQAHNAKERARR